MGPPMSCPHGPLVQADHRPTGPNGPEMALARQVPAGPPRKSTAACGRPRSGVRSAARSATSRGPSRARSAQTRPGCRLAGVSTEYDTWLQQGGVAHPSPELVNAFARALRLCAAEREGLTNLLARQGGGRRTPHSGLAWVCICCRRPWTTCPRRHQPTHRRPGLHRSAWPSSPTSRSTSPAACLPASPRAYGGLEKVACETTHMEALSWRKVVPDRPGQSSVSPRVCRVPPSEPTRDRDQPARNSSLRLTLSPCGIQLVGPPTGSIVGSQTCDRLIGPIISARSGTEAGASRDSDERAW